MKFYLASSFKNIKMVEKVAAVLEIDGHEITEKWWCRPYQVEGLGQVDTTDLKEIYEGLGHQAFYNSKEVRASYEVDFKGVEEADAFIFVATREERKYNGATAEYGIALGLGKPVAVIGVLEKSVLYWPLIRLSSLQCVREWAALLEARQ